MTLAKACRITGLDIRREPDSRPGAIHLMAYYSDGKLCAEVTGYDEGQSLDRLVAYCYKLVQDIVFERDGYCCVRCESFRNLHTHHKIHRSTTRIDSIDNLCTLCHDCHQEIHDGKKPEVE